MIRRAISIVDMMAGWRNPQDTDRITKELNSKLSADYHRRTIYRDLSILHEIGILDRFQVGSKGKQFTWKLDLKKSESIQDCAILIENNGQKET